MGKGLSRAGLALGTALCLALTGCAALPYAHEIESTALMRTLGVDVGTESLDGVAVSSSTGGRPPAGNQPGAPPVVLAAQADTISAACLEMQTYGSDYVFFGDVEQILVGEEQAARGLETILAHMARDPELRLEAQLWIVQGAGASDVLFSAAEGGSGAADRLEAMQADSALGSVLHTRTAREAIVDMGRNGCTILPALTLNPARPGDGGEGERTMTPTGYAIFRDAALAGWAVGETARGIDLLLGKAAGEILELTAPDGSRAALKLTGVKTELKPDVNQGRLMGLSVSCRVESKLAELRGRSPSLNEEGREALEGLLTDVVRTRVEAALEKAQDLNADFLDLGREAGLAAPWHWSTVREQWGEAFQTLPIHLTVSGDIARAG